MDLTKIYTVDLNFSCREFSVRGLSFVVALPVRLGIDFVCASTGGVIQRKSLDHVERN